MGLVEEGDYVEIAKRTPARLFLIARTLSAVLGTGAVLLLLLWARRSLGDGPALGAAFLLAVAFLHVRDSHAIKPDIPLSVGVLLAFLLMVPLVRGPSLRTGAIAGVGVGVAMAMKYPGILLLVPVYAAAVLASSDEGWKRWFPPAAIAAGSSAGLFFAATSPFLVEDPDNYLWIAEVIFPDLFEGVSTTEEWGFAQADETRDKYGDRNWTAGFIHHATVSLRYGAGLLATLMAPFAIGWGFFSGKRMAQAAAVFAVVYLAVCGISPSLYSRYMTPFVGVLFFLISGLLWSASARVPNGRRSVVFALSIAIVAVEPLYATIAHNRIISREDTRVQATQWLTENVERGTHLYSMGEVFMPYGRPVPPPGSKFVMHLEPIAEKLEAAGVQFVVTNEHDLYASTINEEAFAHLAPRLELLADFDPRTERADEAVFEASDPYYVPLHGFAGVERPGPRVRIYRFD